MGGNSAERLLLCAVALALGSPAAPAEYAPREIKQLTDNLVAKWISDPERPELQALARDFPEVVEQIKADLVAMAPQFATLTPEQAYQRGFSAGSPSYRDWQRRNFFHVGSTSDDAATALYENKLAILEHLQKSDISQCSAFGGSGDVRGLDRKDRELMKLFRLRMAHTISATKIGMVHPINDEPTEGDLAALREQILALDHHGKLSDFFINSDDTSISDTDQCQLALLITRSALSLEGPRRGRLLRVFLRDEFPKIQ